MKGYESIEQNLASSLPRHEEEFYKVIVGPKNHDYYLHHFAAFHSYGKAGASWHWPAFFFSFFWFLYRKMWLDAFLYLFWSFFILSVDAAMHCNFILYFVGIFIVPSMYANALYYNHCKDKISAVKASPHDLQRQLDELSRKGGTSLMVALIVPFFFFIWILIRVIIV